MKNSIYILFALIAVIASCNYAEKNEVDFQYVSPNLAIEQVSEHVFRHTSLLNTEDFGEVPCNGMIVMNGKEALVFDTPTNEVAAKELISWLNDTLSIDIVGVVPTHFHVDCLGGLAAFHQAGIPSYAHERTIELARFNQSSVPQQEFSTQKTLKLGDKHVELTFFGEGHTRDNIVAYFPNDQVLFGGCLVKELGANKGNLADANENEWANTIQKVKNTYPAIKWVIPGHGEVGGMDLLAYTQSLFEE